MKSRHLCFALAGVPMMATCLPLSSALLQSLGFFVSGAHHPPTLIRDSQPTHEFHSDQDLPWVIDNSKTITKDNGPTTPPAPAAGHSLSNAQPVVEKSPAVFVQPDANRRRFRGGWRWAARKERLSSISSSTQTLEDVSVTDMDISIGIPSPAPSDGNNTPYPEANSNTRPASREHNDVIIILLVAAFLFVVITVETGGSLCRRSVLYGHYHEFLALVPASPPRHAS